MAEATESERGVWRRAAPVAISALAHASLILLVIVATRGALRLPTPDQPITVEFEPAEPAAPAPPRLVPATPASPSPAAGAPASSASLPTAAPTAAPVAAPKAWRHPTRMLSATVKTERALRHLEKGAAIEQLCDLEAIMQIARAETAFAPDAVVAYAMQDVEVGQGLIVADGAAVHDADGWSLLRFRCRFTQAPRRIVAFEYRLGEAIPRETWSSHALPATVAPLEPEGARENDPASVEFRRPSRPATR